MPPSGSGTRRAGTRIVEPRPGGAKPACSAATLFTVFEPDVGAADLRDHGCLVTSLIDLELVREQLPADTFGRPTWPASSAKTADRSVLGCMNDMLADTAG